MLVGPGLGKPESPEGLPLSHVLNGGEVQRREKECVSAQGLTGGRLKEPKLSSTRKEVFWHFNYPVHPSVRVGKR